MVNSVFQTNAYELARKNHSYACQLAIRRFEMDAKFHAAIYFSPNRI